MIVRFFDIKDKHHFVQHFKHANKEHNVIMRDIIPMDNDLQCTISMRNDDLNLINIPIEYKDLEFRIIDRNKI